MSKRDRKVIGTKFDCCMYKFIFNSKSNACSMWKANCRQNNAIYKKATADTFKFLHYEILYLFKALKTAPLCFTILLANRLHTKTCISCFKIAPNACLISSIYVQLTHDWLLFYYSGNDFFFFDTFFFFSSNF